MAVATRMKTGKGTRVKYEKQDSDDDAQMDDVQITTPKVEVDTEEPPRKKLRTELRSPSPSTPAADAKSAEDPESDDDYRISQSKKQKPRKSSSSTSKAKGKGKAKAQLDTLFDKLPTDVVYMIFSHLHPLDLLRLARTNRMLRSHLMSKASAAAHLSIIYLKLPFSIVVSEPQWAQLLFSRDCSTCTRTNIPNVDWFHRLRLCSRCDRAGVILIIGLRARKAFPHVPDVNMLLDLLPHSNTGSSWTGKYYRIKDIQDVGAEWAIISKKGSDAEIQEFKERRKSETEEIMTHGTFCKAWHRDSSILKRTQNREAKQVRRNEIFARLEALGYNPQDVRDWTVAQSRFLHTSTPLTERRWAAIRPSLEALTIRAQERRLQRDRDLVIRQREAIAESVIKPCLATSAVSPAFHPRLRNLLDSVSFQAIISQPNEVAVSADSFQSALDTIPDQLAKTAKAIQSHLLQRMVNGGAMNVDPSIIESDFSKIGLATSTFFCKTDSHGLPVCSKDDLNSHRCPRFPASPDKCQCLSYGHEASNVVAALLAAANLDPNTTADEMDEMDLRFHCPGWQLAMNWRDAASNAMRSKLLQSSTWEVFSPEDTAAIKRKEMTNNGDAWRAGETFERLQYADDNSTKWGFLMTPPATDFPF
ncbi:hypothetical protein FRC05_003027 [Tulasnella sp. 425]|nr:hypothetical protein FRC05_003027 [Tulasnella sp. 425]